MLAAPEFDAFPCTMTVRKKQTALLVRTKCTRTSHPTTKRRAPIGVKINPKFRQPFQHVQSIGLLSFTIRFTPIIIVITTVFYNENKTFPVVLPVSMCKCPSVASFSGKTLSMSTFTPPLTVLFRIHSDNSVQRCCSSVVVAI